MNAATVKLLCVALVLSASAVSGSSIPGPVKVPSANPVITVDIPNSWEQAETDHGIGCISPDKAVIFFFEIAKSEKAIDALIDDSVTWLEKDNGLKIKASSKMEDDHTVGGIKSKLMVYDADSKEFGPAKVGFLFTPVSGKLLITTFWIDAKTADKTMDTVDKILESVKPVK